MLKYFLIDYNTVGKFNSLVTLFHSRFLRSHLIVLIGQIRQTNYYIVLIGQNRQNIGKTWEA